MPATGSRTSPRARRSPLPWQKRLRPPATPRPQDHLAAWSMSRCVPTRTASGSPRKTLPWPEKISQIARQQGATPEPRPPWPSSKSRSIPANEDRVATFWSVLLTGSPENKIYDSVFDPARPDPGPVVPGHRRAPDASPALAFRPMACPRGGGRPDHGSRRRRRSVVDDSEGTVIHVACGPGRQQGLRLHVPRARLTAFGQDRLTGMSARRARDAKGIGWRQNVLIGAAADATYDLAAAPIGGCVRLVLLGGWSRCVRSPPRPIFGVCPPAGFAPLTDTCGLSFDRAQWWRVVRPRIGPLANRRQTQRSPALRLCGRASGGAFTPVAAG